MYKIITSLINYLYQKKLYKEANEINDFLLELLEEENDDDQIANLSGLRENGIIENMNQGFSLEPFFSTFNNLE